MDKADLPTVRMIPIERIHVLNPRVRGKRVFGEIVTNISHIGLKRPITVSRRPQSQGGTRYDLVCGQGRLEAYQALNQKEIPAIIVDLPEEDCLMMSLIENCARRQHKPIELLREIGALKKRGYSTAQIATKTDLLPDYVRGVIRLLEHGEVRLISALEKGLVPLSIAMLIADSDDADVQKALQKAYQDNQLRGRKLIAVKHLVELRKRRGKGHYQIRSTLRARALSSEALVRAYRKEVDRQRLLVHKAEIAHSKLIFVIEALAKLIADEHFVTLLRAEKLDTMPQYLAEQMAERSKPS